MAPPGNQAANGEHKRHAYSTGRPHSTRQKLMRPHTRSISGAPRAVLDSEAGLFAFRLFLTEEKAGHSPCPDDCAHNDNALHILGAYA